MTQRKEQWRTVRASDTITWRFPGYQIHQLCPAIPGSTHEEGREVSVQRAQLRPDGRRLRLEKQQRLLPLSLSPAATEPSRIH